MTRKIPLTHNEVLLISAPSQRSNKRSPMKLKGGPGKAGSMEPARPTNPHTAANMMNRVSIFFV